MSRGILPTIKENLADMVHTHLETGFDRSSESQCTMLQYVKICRASFEDEPFNEVDSLILSWIAYLNIPEEVLPKRELNSSVTEDHSFFTDTDSCLIRDLLRYEYFSKMLADVWSPDETLDMLYAMALNPRFEKLRICLRREELDHEAGKQFAAVTFHLQPDLAYIAFRGTDRTMTGWEEDFRLCLLDPVPSQLLAAEYLSAAGRVFRGSLITGGHSKGGNLAVYAAAHCDAEVQERIREVYTHDGPGFLKEDLEEEGFKKIRSRIRKTAPQFSVFGMLLRQETEPKIIYSYEKGLMQHNAASWKTEGYRLSEYRYPDRTSQVIKNKLNNWIDNLTEQEKKTFIDTVFDILEETGLEKFGDLKTNFTEIAPVAIREFYKLEPSMQLFLFDLFRQLFAASAENTDPNAELTSIFPAKTRGSSSILTQEEADLQQAMEELNRPISGHSDVRNHKDDTSVASSILELMKKYEDE